MYVYYSATTIRPQVIQKKILELYQDGEIIVFGRYRDFKARIEQEPPDFIITHPELLIQFPDFKPAQRGMRDGSSTEECILVSVKKTIQKDSLTRATIGVVDFLGKYGMDQFVSKLFNIKPRLKRVIKIEDLIPLLTFNMADAILLSERNLVSFKKTSKLDFVVIKSPKLRIGVITIAVNNNSNVDASSENELIRIVTNVLSVLLDIDEWRCFNEK